MTRRLLSPEALAQIRASNERDLDREFVHYAQRDRHVLLKHIAALEAEIEALKHDLERSMTRNTQDLATIEEQGNEIERLRAALQKIIDRPGLRYINFSCDAQAMVDWARAALKEEK